MAVVEIFNFVFIKIYNRDLQPATREPVIYHYFKIENFAFFNNRNFAIKKEKNYPLEVMITNGFQSKRLKTFS